MGSPMTVWMVGQQLVHPAHVRRQELLAAYLLTLPAWLQHLHAACHMRMGMGSPMTVWMVGQYVLHHAHVRRQALLAAYLQPLFLMW